MEDPTILRMNLDHFRRLLETEADPAKRQMILKLIGETEAKLPPDRYPSGAPSDRGVAQMTASPRAPTEPCRARATPVRPTPPAQRPQRDLSEAHLAVCHELSERLTAITNYLAAALRLSEIESLPAAIPLRHDEILEKALSQVNHANEEIKRFRKLLEPAGTNIRPVYRVCFLKEFARFNTVVKPCQRAIIIRAARSRERAIEAAKERFARLEGIHDWRDHAKMIEVSIIEADQPPG
jgi:hypothetical protein